MQQSPPYIIAPEESSINITCCTSGTLLGLHLKQSWPKPSNVIYYEGERKTTVDERFSDRVTFSGPRDNLTITVHHLQLADTGIYTCQAIMENIREIQGPGTSVVVTGRERATPGPFHLHAGQAGLCLPLSGDLPSILA